MNTTAAERFEELLRQYEAGSGELGSPEFWPRDLELAYRAAQREAQNA